MELDMNKLDDDLLRKVLEHLSIEDLLKVRLLSKRFNSLVSTIKIEELVLDGDDQVKFDEQGIYRKFNERFHWFDTDLFYINIVKIKNLADLSAFFRSTIFDLNELKRLRINSSIDYNKFKISDLNRFQQLQHLEIGHYNGSSIDELNLPNLKTLYFRSISHNHNLDLNAPKLETLSSLNLDQIRLKQRESIKRLETDFFSDDCFAFKNLEYLNVFDILNSTEKRTLENLINLKRMRIHPDDCQSEIYYEYIQELVRNLLDEKERVQRDELEIIIDGRKIIDYCEVVNAQSSDETVELLCLEDYFDFYDF